jgi:hypothetical protein
VISYAIILESLVAGLTRLAGDNMGCPAGGRDGCAVEQRATVRGVQRCPSLAPSHPPGPWRW